MGNAYLYIEKGWSMLAVLFNTIIDTQIKNAGVS